ncbi:MAG: HIT family protein [Candidatus Pacearchaeota archaeon]|nr:MAG: HIT family protein [Candidatus Pacearchaeota archaeon]
MDEKEIEKLRKKILEQVERLPEEQASSLREQIKSASPQELENFLKQQMVRGDEGECFFCQLVSGKVETVRIYEDADILCILDIYPANPGHMIVIPKKHFQFMHEIPDALLKKIFIFIKTIEPILLDTTKAHGLSIYIAQGQGAGQKVKHFSVNLIPRFEGDNINFEWQRKKVSKDELEKLGKKIREKSEGIVRGEQEKKEKEKELEEAEKMMKHVKERVP